MCRDVRKDGSLAGRAGSERKLDEAAGENSHRGRITRELLDGAGNGAAVSVDAVSIIALFPADAVHHLVAAARKRTIRTAGGIGEIAVLRSKIAILGKVQTAVAAEHRIESGTGGADGDVGGGGTRGGGSDRSGAGRELCNGSQVDGAASGAQIRITQIAVITLLTGIRDAVAADEQGNDACGGAGGGRRDGIRGRIRGRNGEGGIR